MQNKTDRVLHNPITSPKELHTAQPRLHDSPTANSRFKNGFGHKSQEAVRRGVTPKNHNMNSARDENRNLNRLNIGALTKRSDTKPKTNR